MRRCACVSDASDVLIEGTVAVYLSGTCNDCGSVRFSCILIFEVCGVFAVVEHSLLLLSGCMFCK